MNRDILFKALNANNEWVYGLPRLDPQNKTIYYEQFNYRMTWLEDNAECSQPIKNGTLCQYTGLTDKNGKKIFEGDIIDIHQTVNGYNQFVIEYDNYKFSARYYNQKTKEIRSWYGYDLDELFEINEFEKESEVIGNIYESKINE